MGLFACDIGFFDFLHRNARRHQSELLRFHVELALRAIRRFAHHQRNNQPAANEPDDFESAKEISPDA